MSQRHERDLRKMQDKLPPPITCPSCKEPGYVNLLEVTERINSFNEDKQMLEYTDTSRYYECRCIACDWEQVVK